MTWILGYVLGRVIVAVGKEQCKQNLNQSVDMNVNTVDCNALLLFNTPSTVTKRSVCSL